MSIQTASSCYRRPLHGQVRRYAEEKGLIQTYEGEKRNEKSVEVHHIRQLKKLQKPISRTTASIPHIFTLFWRGYRAGMRVEVAIPPTLLTVSKALAPAFLYTNSLGVIEAVDGPQAAEAFFFTLSRRKKSKRTPIAIHHTNVGSATLYFTRRAVRSVLTTCPYSFHYLQKYVQTKTNCPELLCVIWKPQKPAKFFFIVPRRSGSKPMSPVSRKSEENWVLNRSDYGSSEILDCAQTDPSVLQQCEQIRALLTSFGIRPITELITDYMRDKRGSWVFKSIVNVQVEEKESKKELRPGTVTLESFSRISLQSKIVARSPKPRPSAFVPNSSLLSSSMGKAKKEELNFSMEKRQMDLSEIEEKVKGLKVRRAPHLKLESLPGRKPHNFKSYSEIPNIDKLKISHPSLLPSPRYAHKQDSYESLISEKLKDVSDHYDTMQRYIKEFHDRRANPKRCIYYYSDAFWTGVVTYLAVKLQEDPKTFPMFYRMESSKLQACLSQLIEKLKIDVFPIPVDVSLLEICVELSLPRLDGSAFITLLRSAFKANKMREDELEVAVSVYKDNLQHLLNLNWKKSFSIFLTKRVMSQEFLEKVLYFRNTDLRPQSPYNTTITDPDAPQ